MTPLDGNRARPQQPDTGPHRLLPVVLAGGRSTRFGRDKLREPHEGGLLVDAPIGALVSVLGRPIAVVGASHPEVAARADLQIADAAPDTGPIGGIIAALLDPRGAWGVCVLAGDLGFITAAEVRALVDGAGAAPHAAAVMAVTDGLEPCIAVYRPAALPHLQSHLSSGRRSLHDAIPRELVASVRIDPARARNVNEPKDLRA